MGRDSHILTYHVDDIKAHFHFSGEFNLVICQGGFNLDRLFSKHAIG